MLVVTQGRKALEQTVAMGARSPYFPAAWAMRPVQICFTAPNGSRCRPFSKRGSVASAHASRPRHLSRRPRNSTPILPSLLRPQLLRMQPRVPQVLATPRTQQPIAPALELLTTLDARQLRRRHPTPLVVAIPVPGPRLTRPAPGS